MAASLFISHAAADAKVAAELCRALEGRGFSCWLASRDVAPGENFQAAIVRAIRLARMLLLVFTGAANGLDEVAKELALASQARLQVAPLKVEDVSPSDALAYEFATRQWIDFHADWPRAIEQLCRHVSGVLGSEDEPLAGSPASAPPRPPPQPVAPPTAPAAPTSVDLSRSAPQATPRARAMSPIRLLILMIIAFAIAITVVAPRLRRLMAPATMGGTVPANAAAAPGPANAANAEVPF
jgi:hypothetical protein